MEDRVLLTKFLMRRHVIRHSVCDLIGRSSSVLKPPACELQDLVVVGVSEVEHEVGEVVEGDS